MSQRRSSEFIDKHGKRVRVGDRVRAVGVNEGLRGTVVRLVMDRLAKPFAVRTDDGRITYFHRSWTEREGL